MPAARTRGSYTRFVLAKENLPFAEIHRWIYHASQSLDPPAILWFARGSGSCSAATLWPELMSAFCASSPRVSAETLVPARTGSPAGGLAASRVRVDGGGGLRSLLEGELRCSATRCLCDDESTSPRAHHASGRGTVSSLRSHSAASKLRASLTPPSADSVAAVLRGSASLQGVAVGPGHELATISRNARAAAEVGGGTSMRNALRYSGGSSWQVTAPNAAACRAIGAEQRGADAREDQRDRRDAVHGLHEDARVDACFSDVGRLAVLGVVGTIRSTSSRADTGTTGPKPSVPGGGRASPPRQEAERSSARRGWRCEVQGDVRATRRAAPPRRPRRWP